MTGRWHFVWWSSHVSIFSCGPSSLAVLSAWTLSFKQSQASRSQPCVSGVWQLLFLALADICLPSKTKEALHNALSLAFLAFPSGPPNALWISPLIELLVGACLATLDRISATERDAVSKRALGSCAGFAWYMNQVKREMRHNNVITNSLRSYLSQPVFIAKSGMDWWQDLAILSPQGCCNNTHQLRLPSRHVKIPASLKHLTCWLPCLHVEKRTQLLLLLRWWGHCFEVGWLVGGCDRQWLCWRAWLVKVAAARWARGA